MKFLKIFLILLASFCVTMMPVTHAQDNNDAINNLSNNIKTEGTEHKQINEFTKDVGEGYFIKSDSTNANDALSATFFNIAQGIKNAMLLIAVIFLIIGVIKLFTSDGSDDDVKKWKYNIAWTAAGAILLQMAYSIWATLLKNPSNGTSVIIDAEWGWEFWNNILEPLVGLVYYFTGFIFLAMMIYAFYIIVTGSGDEEKFGKGKNTLIFALVGFILIQIPHRIVSLLYSGVPKCEQMSGHVWDLAKTPCTSNSEARFEGAVELFANIIKYFNTFLTIFCILMAIYAGWLLFISGGDEEKISRAKRIIIYIVIGLVLLVASHAIFIFFILEGITF